MIASLTATAAALAAGLPIFPLGELLRGGTDRHPIDQHTSSTRKDVP